MNKLKHYYDNSNDNCYIQINNLLKNVILKRLSYDKK